jgi:hypothetical protein
MINTTTTFVDAFILSRHSDFLVFALDALSNLKAIHMRSWGHQQNYLQNHLSSFLIQTWW